MLNGIFKEEKSFHLTFQSRGKLRSESKRKPGKKSSNETSRFCKCFDEEWTICEFDWMYNLDCACVQTHNLILIWYFLWWFSFLPPLMLTTSYLKQYNYHSEHLKLFCAWIYDQTYKGTENVLFSVWNQERISSKFNGNGFKHFSSFLIKRTKKEHLIHFEIIKVPLMQTWVLFNCCSFHFSCRFYTALKRWTHILCTKHTSFWYPPISLTSFLLLEKTLWEET